ncbi:MAG: KamA family radical SAM protein [Prolixibacteraceae bacterium]
MNVSAVQETDSSDRDVPLGFPLKNGEERAGSNDPVFAGTAGLTAHGEASKLFLQKHFPGVSVNDWNDWRWQIRNSYTSLTQLSSVIDLSGTEKQVLLSTGVHLPLRITPYYASLLSNQEDGYAIRKAMVPGVNELAVTRGEHADPLNEEANTPVPHLVHRYPDRVLFLATGFCSAYCRYCTRTHMVAKEKVHFNRSWEPAIEYIRGHKEIRDVLISGGDPLTMPDAMLRNLLAELRSIPHIEILRIGTKVPVVLPQRITASLTKMLKQFHPLMISIHFMHPAELTPETAEACIRLADAGIPLGSQTVLLKGINDEVPIMKKLMQGLLKIRVRPYYLYQCDPIPGSAHFRTPVNKGVEIISGLRGFTSGYAIPSYVIDAPGGGGKIPLLPDYLQGRENGNIILKNYEGKTFYYPDAE